ncbi:hypothetical protein [Caproicibacter sp. BJN0012]|uniref:hypothetical protein n=1 Tax=Caproicibacter sp. BJN0012 TaxID=3110227 RepID=UPI002E1319A2
MMAEITRNENNFIGYEYKDITVSRSMESVYADGYANFGWTLEDTSTPVQGVGSVTMKFKRDRKIRNKAELGRLQRQFESCAGQIESLEKAKTNGAMIAAFSIGLVGTAFMAGSVFSYLAGMLPLCIILAIPAFIGWILPYFCFLSIRRKKTDKVTPLIDQKYDEMYEVCEKANGLLAK